MPLSKEEQRKLILEHVLEPDGGLPVTVQRAILEEFFAVNDTLEGIAVVLKAINQHLRS